MRSGFLITAAVLFLGCSDNFRNPAAPAERTTAAAADSTPRRRAVTRPPHRTAISGEWGGQHVQLELQNGIGRIEFDCAHGGILQAIVPGSDGSFSVEGTFALESGRPPVGEGDNSRPARYSGTVSGDRMELKISVDGQELADRFTLVKDASARLVKCL